MIQKTAFCEKCQAETTHTVDYEDSIDPKTNTVLFEKVAIKLTCENTTDQEEHAIRMSPNVTSEEIDKILQDHKGHFENEKVEKVDMMTRLTNLFK